MKNNNSNNQVNSQNPKVHTLLTTNLRSEPAAKIRFTQRTTGISKQPAEAEKLQAPNPATASLVFMWDNFGPMHHDRLKAAAEHFAAYFSVTGIEIAGNCDVYAWRGEAPEKYDKITLFPDAVSSVIGQRRRFVALLRTCLRSKAQFFFFCHYQEWFVFTTALCLRLLGKKVFVIQNSKFDDVPRRLLTELFKPLFYFPYCGALIGSPRTADYLAFLGMRKRPKVMGCNTLSIDRIRALAGSEPAPRGTPFAKRHFSIVARLVPKKNLLVAIEAYAVYASQVNPPRPLHIYGNGPLEDALRARINALGLENYIILHGFIQTEGIARALGNTVALILPSIEEQFGNVIIEAQAVGLPVILSDVCGACDELVRSGVNGFIFKPDDPHGLAFFMTAVSEREDLWRALCEQAQRFAPLGDVARFNQGVEALIQPRKTETEQRKR